MGELKVFRKHFEEAVKCNACGWKVRNLYVLAEDEKEARDLLKMGEGMCADCLLEMHATELR